MTELLYYHDAYALSFQARIIERLTHNGHPGLVLDRTLFYPTSGGQPFDSGTINDVPTREIFVRDEDGAVVHLLAGETAAGDAEGKLDWPRRFDHMQQHSGQHILSQAFERVAGAATVGFHMSAGSSTLDLDTAHLSQETIAEVEELANAIIWQNRPITIQFVSVDEALNMPLRKLPETKNGQLRLVSVDSFDLSACGGTHVARTGEVGIVKVVKTERQGGKTRVEFLCGRRALIDYDRKNLVLARLSNKLTTGYLELENSISSLRDDLKTANRSLKKKTNRLIEIEAKNLAANASTCGAVQIIIELFIGREPAELRRLVSRISAMGDTVVLVGLAGEKAQLIFARSDNVQLPIDLVLKETLPLLKNATGGGSSKFAQGGGSPAKANELYQALASAETRVRSLLSSSPTKTSTVN